jgi:hypothetical protein
MAQLFREYKGGKDYLCSAHPVALDGRDDTPGSAALTLLCASRWFTGDILYSLRRVPAVTVLAAAATLW